MPAVLHWLSLALAGAGSLVVVLSFSLLARWWAGIPVAMELWTAAGLLNLAGEPDWTRIATAAVIISIRKLILWRRAAAYGQRGRAWQ